MKVPKVYNRRNEKWIYANGPILLFFAIVVIILLVAWSL